MPKNRYTKETQAVMAEMAKVEKYARRVNTLAGNPLFAAQLSLRVLARSKDQEVSDQVLDNIIAMTDLLQNGFTESDTDFRPSKKPKIKKETEDDEDDEDGDYEEEAGDEDESEDEEESDGDGPVAARNPFIDDEAAEKSSPRRRSERTPASKRGTGGSGRTLSSGVTPRMAKVSLDTPAANTRLGKDKNGRPLKSLQELANLRQA